MNFYDIMKTKEISNAELGRAIKRAVYEGLEVKGKPKVNQDFDANMQPVIDALHGKTPVKKEEIVAKVSAMSNEQFAEFVKKAGFLGKDVYKQGLPYWQAVLLGDKPSVIAGRLALLAPFLGLSLASSGAFSSSKPNVVSDPGSITPSESGVKPSDLPELVSEKNASLFLKKAGYNDTQVKALMEIICK